MYPPHRVGGRGGGGGGRGSSHLFFWGGGGGVVVILSLGWKVTSSSKMNMFLKNPAFLSNPFSHN